MHRAKTWGTVGSWVSQSEEQYEHAWGFQTWCDVTWNDNQWVGALIPLGNQTASPHKTRRAQCLHSPCGHDPSWNHRWDSSLALQGLAPCIGRPPNLSLSLTHTYVYIYTGIYIFKIFNCLCSCIFLKYPTSMANLEMFNYFFFTLPLLKWLKCMGSIFGCLALPCVVKSMRDPWKKRIRNDLPWLR